MSAPYRVFTFPAEKPMQAIFEDPAMGMMRHQGWRLVSHFFSEEGGRRHVAFLFEAPVTQSVQFSKRHLWGAAFFVALVQTVCAAAIILAG